MKIERAPSSRQTNITLDPRRDCTGTKVECGLDPNSFTAAHTLSFDLSTVKAQQLADELHRVGVTSNEFKTTENVLAGVRGDRDALRERNGNQADTIRTLDRTIEDLRQQLDQAKADLLKCRNKEHLVSLSKYVTEFEVKVTGPFLCNVAPPKQKVEPLSNEEITAVRQTLARLKVV